METLAIVLFAITYIMLLLLPRYRPHIALTSAAAFIVVGIALNLVFGFIDWNVILMIAGTRVLYPCLSSANARPLGRSDPREDAKHPLSHRGFIFVLRPDLCFCG